MADPISLRVLNIVATWLAEDADIPDRVTIDVPEWSYDVAQPKQPTLAVVAAAAADAPFERETDRVVVDPLTVHILGYVKAPTEDDGGVPIIPPLVTDTRERFLQVVLRRLTYATPTDSLDHRLLADYHAHGAGTANFRQVGSPIRDQGDKPPLGDFTIPCRAVLHYREGEF